MEHLFPLNILIGNVVDVCLFICSQSRVTLLSGGWTGVYKLEYELFLIRAVFDLKVGSELKCNII